MYSFGKYILYIWFKLLTQQHFVERPFRRHHACVSYVKIIFTQMYRRTFKIQNKKASKFVLSDQYRNLGKQCSPLAFLTTPNLSYHFPCLYQSWDLQKGDMKLICSIPCFKNKFQKKVRLSEVLSLHRKKKPTQFLMEC